MHRKQHRRVIDNKRTFDSITSTHATQSLTLDAMTRHLSIRFPCNEPAVVSRSGPSKMRHFYKNVLSGLVFWLLLSQSLSLFESLAAAENPVEDVEETEEVDDGDEEGAEGRDFGDFFGLVRDQLSGGDVATGRSATSIFNTTLAFTIPLFSFTLPDRAGAGKDYTKQAALSLFGLALAGGLAVVPYVWSASQGGHQKHDWLVSNGKDTTARQLDAHPLASSPFLMTVMDVASRAGFDPNQCVLRSVCEAHQHPERFGYLVLPVRLLTIQWKSRADGGPSDYQMAADYGRDEADGCDRRYRCAFSMIGAVKYLLGSMYPPTKS